jgi:hypothetical protein
MKRLVPLLLAVLLVQALSARAAESQDCPPAVLGLLGRELKVARFAAADDGPGKAPSGVVLANACRRLPDDPKLTLVAAAWDAHKEDEKALALAIVDEAAGTVVALLRDDLSEDATTHVHEGSLRLDTAPYQLAPGVRAFGLDVSSDNGGCGDGGVGPMRTLYVREGRTLRPVLAGLFVSGYTYLRGNQPRCVADQREADTAIIEDTATTIGLGAPGKGGWRDLVLTVTAHRSDKKPARKPLRFTVPYDGGAYDLKAFENAMARWSR